MKIDFPDHACGHWQETPFWLFWRPQYRRRHWRWIVDHRGCECIFYWEYRRWVWPSELHRETPTPPSGLVAA